MRSAPLALSLILATSCAKTEVGLGMEDATAGGDGGAQADAAPGQDAPPANADAGSGEDALTGADAEGDDGGIGAEPGEADSGVNNLPHFSFFVTSLEAMVQLSGSQDGFGGDLRHGEATGLAGADRICREAAELGLPGAGQKEWRAFLSATDDGNGGGAVHAIERIGTGPWYDRNGRLVATNVAGLLMTRPAGDAQVRNDLPNERGESQQNQPGPGAGGTADNHDVLTGSNTAGHLASNNLDDTCNDWSSTDANLGRPQLGHSWPARSGQSWTTAHPAAGCPALVNLMQNGPGLPGCVGVGCGGGYGAIYCFSTTP